MPTDPQGYPIQQYKNMQDVAVLRILSDGTVVLNNNNSNLTDTTVELLIGDGDPNGIIVAPEGSLYIDFTTPDIWQNQDNDTTWKSVGNQVPPPSGVTSFNTRSGAVSSAFDDYAAVAGLTLGENSHTRIFFFNGNGLIIQANDFPTSNQVSINFDGVTPALTLANGVGGAGTTRIVLDSSGNLLLFSTSGSVDISAPAGLTLNGAKVLSALGLPVFANNAAAITGGLAVGDFYRTGADPDPVCQVH